MPAVLLVVGPRATSVSNKKMTSQQDNVQAEPISMGLFLEAVPPGSTRTFKNAFEGSNASDLPALQLLCSSEACDGYRTFRAEQGIQGAGGDSQWVRLVLAYKCRSCETEQKLYFLLSQPNYVNNHVPIEIRKIGEWPPFGAWVPSRLLKIVGPDKELFLKGKRAEGQACRRTRSWNRCLRILPASS